VQTVTLLSTPPRDTCISGANRHIRHHPLANYDSCSTGLAVPALRRMFCSDEGASEGVPLRERESSSFAHAHAPAACTGNRATVRDAKRHVARMRLESHAREECSRRSFSPTHLTVRGESLGPRIASGGPENRPRCLRRLVQVRSTHKLIRKGVCDEIKLRPGRTNLEPIAR